MSSIRIAAALFLVLAIVSTRPVGAQTYSLKVDPDPIHLKVGETVKLYVTPLKDGVPVELTYRVFNRAGSSIEVTDNTNVKAILPGTFRLSVLLPVENAEPIWKDIPVVIDYPPLKSVEIEYHRNEVMVGESAHLEVSVVDETGLSRPDVNVRLSSSNTAVASLDEFGQLRALRPGRTTIRADVDGLVDTQDMNVINNPVSRIEFQTVEQHVRTGDVVQIGTIPRDADDKVVDAAPVQLSLQTSPDDFRGAPASAELDPDGRFVAEVPGLYTVVARSADAFAQLTIQVRPRDIQRDIEVLGHGKVLDVHTSDLWVWEGVDGRDYAVTGTWSANGDAYFWDVTDPTNLIAIDTINVDARTVNDVKVSEDGTICVISREGASNRKNGIVILDCTDPTSAKILSEYDDELTGGVHNVFIYQHHIYAVNNGRRYDIINIDDPTKPVRVGRFELDTPGHAVHDVWIEDGIAYSSNWRDGLQLVDVGSGMTMAPRTTDDAKMPGSLTTLPGGTPSNPVKIAEYSYPSGWNHAAFPFHSASTGKFFVIAGDEAFPYSTPEGAPERAAGWLHFVDFTDLANPKEVARYEVPEAGSHNFWVDGDVLYAAMYNGGLRVVDISGELMGDLYRQGREIARFFPTDVNSVIPNAPMVWGPMLYKGTIFLSDHYSGLWAVRLAPPATP